ncbi:MAG: hypothetical protein SFT91_04050 [Rickettsiaceae bacterium]|nr:hypothetical protein [Rickettsiaceae bacterium]
MKKILIGISILLLVAIFYSNKGKYYIPWRNKESFPVSLQGNGGDINDKLSPNQILSSSDHVTEDNKSALSSFQAQQQDCKKNNQEILLNLLFCEGQISNLLIEAKNNSYQDCVNSLEILKKYDIVQNLREEISLIEEDLKKMMSMNQYEEFGIGPALPDWTKAIVRLERKNFECEKLKAALVEKIVLLRAKFIDKSNIERILETPLAGNFEQIELLAKGM